jgi:hypothetical protein
LQRLPSSVFERHDYFSSASSTLNIHANVPRRRFSSSHLSISAQIQSAILGTCSGALFQTDSCQCSN